MCPHEELEDYIEEEVSLGPRGLSYQGHLVFSYCVHILQKCRVGALALKLWFYVPTYISIKARLVGPWQIRG